MRTAAGTCHSLALRVYGSFRVLDNTPMHGMFVWAQACGASLRHLCNTPGMFMAHSMCDSDRIDLDHTDCKCVCAVEGILDMATSCVHTWDTLIKLHQLGKSLSIPVVEHGEANSRLTQAVDHLLQGDTMAGFISTQRGDYVAYAIQNFFPNADAADILKCLVRRCARGYACERVQ